MKKILFILPALTSCSTFSRKSAPPSPNKGYFSQKKEGNSSVSVEDHPEFPVNLSPETPAWTVALWIGLTIILVCMASAMGRYLQNNWPRLRSWAGEKWKNLTKKKK